MTTAPTSVAVDPQGSLGTLGMPSRSPVSALQDRCWQKTAGPARKHQVVTWAPSSQSVISATHLSGRYDTLCASTPHHLHYIDLYIIQIRK